MAKNRSFSSLVNLQSKSINFKFGNLSPKYQGYSLTFWPKIAHFHHLSICNQNQLISNLVICHQNTKAIALLFGTNRSFSSIFNLQSKSINFKFGHCSPKYQRYSLTFWPQIAHFHHFSICNQNQSVSILVSCHQNTKAIALLFGHKSLIAQNQFHHFSICNQNQLISNLVICHQNTKAIALLFVALASLTFWPLVKNRSFESLFNLQSQSVNFKFGHFSVVTKYQGYSLTFLPNIAHFHHFSICNQNQSISNLLISHRNTKTIALLFGHKSLIFITFQSAIKINQFQIWSFFTNHFSIPRL